MTEDSERIHAEALKLQENEALELVLSQLREQAREALVQTPAEQTDRIRDHQAMARAIDQIHERIDRLVVTSAPKPKAGLA